MLKITHYHSSRFIEMFGDTFRNEKEWAYNSLSKITSIVLGTTPSSSNPDYWDGDIKWITPAELNDDSFYVYDSERHITEAGVRSAALKSFPAGTVIFSTRAPIGKTAIAGCEMYCNQGFKNFICSEKLNPVYLFYTLKSHKEELQKMGTGSTFLELSKKTIEGISISTPPRVLQDEFEVIYKQADKSKFTNFKSRFIEMFGQVDDTQSHYPIKRMVECCSYISDGSHYSPTEDSQGTYPMLSVKDMTDNGFSYSGCKYIGRVDYEKLVANGCKPQKNDVLVAKDGSYFKYAFVVNEDKEQAILSSIAMLRPYSEMVRPRYLAYYMLTDAVVKLVEKNYLTGTAIRRVILKGFKVLPVIVPDLEAQDDFIHILEQADKSKYLN